MSVKRSHAALASLVVVTAGLGACTSEQSSSVSTPVENVSDLPTDRTQPKSETATESPKATVPDVPRMPLTGTPVAAPSDIPQRPAVVVKIPMDDPAAMPHAGLNRADIVFQTIINDRFSRLIAVFQSQSADPLGPIRSGREQDIPIIAEFERPLVGWSGGNAGVNREMRVADRDGLLIDLNYPEHPQLFRRRGDRPRAPHNLFTSTDVLWAQTPADFVVPDPVFPYLAPGDEPGGEAATAIEVRLDSVRSAWRYDPDSERYLKWNNGSPHMTEEDGQVWADNVIVAVLDYGVSPIDANNPLGASIGSNPVFVFSRGTVRVGEWVRLDPTRGWGLYDNVRDLNEIGLVAGRTWVELPRSRPGVLVYGAGGAAVQADTAEPTTEVAPPTPATSAK